MTVNFLELIGPFYFNHIFKKCEIYGTTLLGRGKVEHFTLPHTNRRKIEILASFRFLNPNVKPLKKRQTLQLFRKIKISRQRARLLHCRKTCKLSSVSVSVLLKKLKGHVQLKIVHGLFLCSNNSNTYSYIPFCRIQAELSIQKFLEWIINRKIYISQVSVMIAIGQYKSPLSIRIWIWKS